MSTTNSRFLTMITTTNNDDDNDNDNMTWKVVQTGKSTMTPLRKAKQHEHGQPSGIEDPKRKNGTVANKMMGEIQGSSQHRYVQWKCAS
jgi:hypothetical protein